MNFLTTADIAARYGRTYRTATRWCQRGLFPHLIKGPRTESGHSTKFPRATWRAFDRCGTGGQRPNRSTERPAAAASSSGPLDF